MATTTTKDTDREFDSEEEIQEEVFDDEEEFLHYVRLLGNYTFTQHSCIYTHFTNKDPEERDLQNPALSKAITMVYRICLFFSFVTPT